MKQKKRWQEKKKGEERKINQQVTETERIYEEIKRRKGGHED